MDTAILVIAITATIVATATMMEMRVSATITCTTGPRRDAVLITTVASWSLASTATHILSITTAVGWVYALQMDLFACVLTLLTAVAKIAV
jgi:hypothetical protein